MHFLTPLAGLIAAAIAAPLLLLLYFLKLRRREEIVPSTVLWRKTIEDLQVNAPFQRLRRNLLLLLQMLVLAALALALTQPTIPYRPTAGARSVLLIDRSASMSTRDGDDKGKTTRLDEAKRRATELVSALPRGAEAMVIAYDDRAEIVQGFTTDSQQLRRAIESVQPTDRQTRLKLAYQLADAHATMRSGASAEMIKPPEVWVYSDGRVLDGEEISIRSEVRYEKIGSDKTRNVGIVSLSARRNYEKPTEVQVFARLANSGPDPVEADVQLTVDGRITRVAKVSLLPERWTEEQRQEAERNGQSNRDAVEFTLDLPQSAVVKVEQMLREGDALSADDSASIIVPPPKSLSVALVTEGGDPFLEKLVRSLNLRDPVQITPAEWEAKDAAWDAGKDVVIFDNYRPRRVELPPAPPPTSDPKATAAARPTAPKVGGNPSGNFIYFNTLPEGLRLHAKMIDGALLQSTGLQPVLDWKREHPILRGLALGKLVADGGIELQPASESEMLVEGTRGPMIVLHREGRQTHLAVAFDPLQSNWPFLVSWPMFLHNTMQYFATSGDLSVRESYLPGATPRLPRSAVSDLKQLSLRTPDGKSLPVNLAGTGDIALPPLEHVGVYELQPPVAGFERLAVNLLDQAESNTLPSGSPPGGIGQTIVAGTSKARLELWWWLVLAGAIPLLMVEWFVYARRTR
jgi:Mg-chelatase subunit ChlD